MRVIGGRAKGRRLKSLKGMRLRPTSDKIRESIFDILQNRVKEKRVLDLFAGTGALGIEALSRGAKDAVFVENHGAMARVIKENLQACQFLGSSRVFLKDFKIGIKSLEKKGEKFDLIFLDPPYERGFIKKALTAIAKYEIINNNAIIVTEHTIEEKVADKYGDIVLEDQRRYGRTIISIFNHRPHKIGAIA